MNRPFPISRQTYQYLGLLMLLLVSLLSLGRAYQTEAMSFVARLGLWTIICGLIFAQISGLYFLARSKLNKILSALLALVVTNLLLAIQLDLLKHTPLLPKEHDPYWEFVAFLSPAVLVVGGTVLLLLQGSEKHRTDNSHPEGPETDVLAVQAQEHYLLITRRESQQIERARFKDMLEALPEGAGLQVHRSWWVAKQAVRSINRRGRDYVIKLTDGREVPVARSRVTLLRDQGWL